MLKIIKFQEGELSIKYLGLPLSMNQINDKDCARLYGILQNRLEGKSGKLLSIARRLKLTHMVIIAIIMYWPQTHNTPAKSIQKIEKIVPTLSGRENIIKYRRTPFVN